MRRRPKIAPAAIALLFVLSACPGDSKPKEPSLPRGGTLRVAAYITVWDSLDPQTMYFPDGFELFRCCLLRTLMSYVGRDGEHAGAVLRPDLAATRPSVSRDKLTWTFRIRKGVRYAPPLNRVEVTAQDFVRALNRTARIEAAYPSYYTVIRGFEDYAARKADSIAGLETPDRYTLVIRLTSPTGDLDYRFGLAATAPIPPLPSRPDSPFGVATGHDADYGRFLIGAGPYMIEGTPDVDFSAPADRQKPIRGLAPPNRLTLVRNPSWSSAADPIRKAYVDRIEFAFGPKNPTEKTTADLVAKIDRGEQDVFFSLGVPRDVIDRYGSDPQLHDRLLQAPGTGVLYITMNVAVRPLDDIHVRRAIALAIDRESLRRKSARSPLNPPGPTTVADHFLPNALVANALLDYKPLGTRAGSPSAARDEMRLSRYDRNHDGICDHPACKAVQFVFAVPDPDRRAAGVASDLSAIGIDVRLRPSDAGEVFEVLLNPQEHAGLGVDWGWFPDYPNPAGFFIGQLAKGSVGSNPTLIGASPSQLKGWGYDVLSVASIDDRIDQCRALLGSEQLRCWARLDKFVMEELAAYVPFASIGTSTIVGERVASASLAYFSGLPALDLIPLKVARSPTP